MDFSAKHNLSIIIVSYNCKEFLVEALESIGKFVKESHEIIVIDNASVDNTETLIRSSYPHVIFVANKQNSGFSAANNQGVLLSKGEFILLLNPDAKLVDDHISQALDYLNGQPQTLVGPKILNPDLSLQDSVFKYPTFWDVLRETFFLTYFFKESISRVLNGGNYALSGACLLISKQNYNLLNGLDKDLFWMDDVDFCLRAKKLGIQVKYFPEWTVVHVVGQSSKKNYKLSIANQLISKLKFFRKHRSWLNYSLSLILIKIHILLRIIVLLPLAPFNSLYRLKFLAYCHSLSLFFKYIFTYKKETF